MSIIEFIRDRAQYYNCPVCGKRLKGCDVRMLNHVEDRFTVQVTCAACQVTFIVVLAIQGQGVDSDREVEIEVTVEQVQDGDLAASEVAEAAAESDEDLELVAGAGPIELDELLDVHLLLRQFDGSLTDLLKQPQPKS